MYKTPSKIKQRYRGQIFLLTNSIPKYWELLKTLPIGQSLTCLTKRVAFSTLYVMFLLKLPEKNAIKKNVLAKALDLVVFLKQYTKNELQLFSMFYISLICLRSILALDHRNLTIIEPFLLYEYKKISCRSFFESDQDVSSSRCCDWGWFSIWYSRFLNGFGYKKDVMNLLMKVLKSSVAKMC